ncbi:HAD family hydrolase [Arenimonas sp. GDDSR-1]|uniref:HAD family hydrolase n=1 Tax=Arenimonas sp. GDDSR-1 TaxID=2950125 RepID=UPI002639EA7F|nr:HAD family hydrolase [Arenimonas sp. GDDSR-1]
MNTFILDFDGTLCDTRPVIRRALLELFKQAGRAIPDDLDLLSLIGNGHTIQETLQILGVSAQHVPQWISDYRHLYSRHEHLAGLFDGVADTLSTLHAQRDRLVLLSNKGHMAVERALLALDIGRYFDLILAEQPGQPGKPDPSVFSQRIAPAFSGLKPSGCIMVGDTRTDLAFAKAIGSRACFAAYGYGQEKDCRAVGYDFRLESFPDILTI